MEKSVNLMKFQITLKLMFFVVIVVSAFFSGWAFDLGIMAQRSDLPAGGYRLSLPVGLAVNVEQGPNRTVLSVPLGEEDGLEIGDYGMVTRKEKIVAIVVVANLDSRVSVAQVVETVGLDHPIGYGARVEFTTVDLESLEPSAEKSR